MQDLIAFSNENPMIFIGFVFIVSTFIGSFLNVVIYRIPLMLEREWFSSIHDLLSERLKEKKLTYLKLIDDGCAQCHHKPSLEDLGNGFNGAKALNIAWPPSNCPHCGNQIRSYENIPLISYLLILKGKCAGCKAHISWQYPIIELITGLLSAGVAYYFGFSLTTFFMLLFLWILICLMIIDLQHYLLPDNLTLPLMWLGLIAAHFHFIPVGFSDAFLGAVFGYLSLWLVYWVFKLLFKKEGMGYGDFKLLAALGAWLGLGFLPFIIFISAFLGAIIGSIYLWANKKNSQHPIPYGPYLVSAGLIVLFWGSHLKQYLYF